MRRYAQAGFTIVEMLIVAILMTIIVGAVAMVFAGATNVVEDTEAQHEVTQAARHVFERMSNDLYGMVAWNTKAQRFIMQNGIVSGTTISYQAPGGETGPHYYGAADRLIFRSNTTFGSVSTTWEVTYELEKDPDPQRQATIITNRPMFTLIRRARVMMPTESVTTVWTGVPNPAGGAPATHSPNVSTNGDPITHPAARVCCEEVGHYLLSFNLEYMANTLNFSQLQNPTPHPFADALGNGAGANDGVPSPGNPYRIPYVRVTMIVIDNRGERNERVFSRVISIPMG